MLVTPDIHIDERELSEQFVRASGPGGQNVNKVATAVQLRFDAARSPSLPPDVRDRLLGLASHLATDDGVLLITARRHRTQEQNRADARERLAALVRAAAAPPPPPRTATRPTRASQRRRVDDKRARGATKSLRRDPDRSDDGG